MRSSDISLAAEIKWMIVISGLIHLIFIGLIVTAQNFSRQKRVIIPPYTTVVDLVNLPVKKKRVLVKKKKRRAAVKKKKRRVIVKKKKPVVSKPVKKERENELLKKLAALEKQWTNEEKILSEEQKRIAEKRILEKAELSERLKTLKEKWSDGEEQLFLQKRITPFESHNSVKLDSPNLSSQYLSIIIDSINENWKLPIIQQRYSETKSVTISFRIHRNGDISNTLIEKSSGTSVLDKAAMQAVIDTKHLPRLPDEFTENYLGVHFRFEYSYFY